MEYSRAMGLDIIQGDHEDAPGQLELNISLTMCLETPTVLTTYRQICAQVARENNLIACFMSKPFMGVSASAVTTICRCGKAARWRPITWGINHCPVFPALLSMFPAARIFSCRIKKETKNR